MERSALRQLAAIAAVQVLVMATWFSASAVVPALRAGWQLTAGGAVWLTASVQLGFVTGAVTAAVLNLADRVPAHRLVAVEARARLEVEPPQVVGARQHAARQVAVHERVALVRARCVHRVGPIAVQEQRDPVHLGAAICAERVERHPEHAGHPT